MKKRLKPSKIPAAATAGQPEDDLFGRSLARLGISDYRDAIYKSNSHGELFHILDYIELARHYKGTPEQFRDWFVRIVAHAEQHWKRPESVYQHIFRIIQEAKSQS